jgi:hypothetical protein
LADGMTAESVSIPAFFALLSFSSLFFPLLICFSSAVVGLGNKEELFGHLSVAFVLILLPFCFPCTICAFPCDAV